MAIWSENSSRGRSTVSAYSNLVSTTGSRSSNEFRSVLFPVSQLYVSG